MMAMTAQEEMMGEILEFRLAEKDSNQPDKLPDTAAVYIFPGVRIERKEFSLADRLYSASEPGRKSCQPRQKSKE